MKIRRITWLALLVAAVFAFILSQSPPFHRATAARIVFGRDVHDITPTSPSKATPGFDPYFNRVNYFANIVLSGTNAIAQGR
ncbi:MAG TPA: hypothetical protein VNZ64_16800 [Candidatus Acidoferrum sp.]|jgi:hypothetical protein|nr:hypothetical protein [Candidatus Acidoferrum sp.]